ncbi:hypothetical protein ACFFLM_15370 [Deinococcus oregonensis]|uniref:Uncharacterized protein n=1 Tax=Deinococcus oregonensis TaxID=1805970 RepID=A0ABV6B0S2_9DEIO
MSDRDVQGVFQEAFGPLPMSLRAAVDGRHLPCAHHRLDALQGFNPGEGPFLPVLTRPFQAKTEHHGQGVLAS